jgi:predicted nucleic-acid-binding Zn-ribbon protein
LAQLTTIGGCVDVNSVISASRDVFTVETCPKCRYPRQFQFQVSTSSIVLSDRSFFWISFPERFNDRFYEIIAGIRYSNLNYSIKR